MPGEERVEAAEEDEIGHLVDHVAAGHGDRVAGGDHLAGVVDPAGGDGDHPRGVEERALRLVDGVVVGDGGDPAGEEHVLCVGPPGRS